MAFLGVLFTSGMMVATLLMWMEMARAGEKICPVAEDFPDEEIQFEKDVEIVDFGRGTVELQWDITQCESGYPIVGYTIEYREFGEEEWLSANEFPKEATSGVQDGLDGAKHYEFRVTAKTGKGMCRPSQPVYALPASPPRYVNITSYSSEAIGLQWEVPENNGGKEITGYSVLYKNRFDKLAEWEHGVHVQAGTLQANQGMLDLDPTFYYYVVVAYNMAGFGQPSERVYAERPNPPRNLKILQYDMNDQFVQLAWQEPVNESTVRTDQYTIYYKELDSDTWIQGVMVSGDQLKTKINVPKRGAFYDFAITASNIVGESDQSQPVLAAKAGPPRNVKLMSVDGERANIKWEVPFHYGGQPITEYVVEYRVKDSDTWQQAAPVPATTTNATLDGLTELKNKYSYEVRVITSNAAGSSDPSETLTFGVPDPPENIKITDIDKNEEFMSLTWQKPTNVGGDDPVITNYHVEFRKRGKGDPWTKGITTKELSVHQGGLDFHAGDTYEFRIYAENMIGRSKPSPIVFVERPSPPLNLSITKMDLDTGEAELTWETPKIDYGVPVDHYTIEYKMKGARDDWTERIVPGDQLHSKFKDLHKNATYVFRVKAANIVGFSEPSNMDSVEKPSQPLDLNVNNIDKYHGTAYLSWIKPKSVGGREIDGYIIQFREHSYESDDISWSEIELPAKIIENKNMIFHNITDIWPLVHGSLLEFRVMAANIAGRGEPSNIAFIDLPSRPRDFDIIDIDPTSGKAQLKWSPPLNDGGAEIKYYVLEFKEKDSDDWEEIKKTVPGHRRRVTTDDIPGIDEIEYNIRIRAVNIAGMSLPPDDLYDSSVISMGKPDPPENVRVTRIKNPQSAKGSVELTWSEPKKNGGRVIVEYSLEYAEATTDIWIQGNVLPHNTNRKDLHVEQELDLRYKHYELRLRARNTAGYSDYTAPIIIRPPSPPENLNIKNINLVHMSAELEWQAPTETGTGNVDGYIIEYREKDRGHWATGGANIDELNHNGIQNNLVNIKDNVYEFRVRAKNMAGKSPPSSTAFVEKPLPPRNVDLVEMDPRAGTAKLTWSEPEKPTKGIITDITAYVIEYRVKEAQRSTWKSSRVRRVPGKLRTGTVTNLDLKTSEYEFRVVAQNMAGSGEPSEIVHVAKPTPPKEFNIKTIKYENGSVVLEWKAPDNIERSVIQYTIQYKIFNTEAWTNGETVDGGQLTATQSGLDLKNKKYVFRVFATNMAGPGNASNEDYVDRPPKPSKLWIDDLQYENKTVFLVWEEVKEGEVVDYIVEYKPKDGIWKNSKNRLTKNNFLKLENLDFDNNVYEYRVIAKNIAGESEPSEAVYFDKPAKPLDLKVEDMNIKDRKAILTILNPKDDTILKYEIEYFDENKIRKKIDNDELSKIIVNSSRISFLVSNLDINKHNYAFQIKAFNKAGYSETSNTDSVEKPGPPVNLNVPTVFYALGTKNASIDVYWEAPTSNGGRPILGYSLEYDDESKLWTPAGLTDTLHILLKVNLDGKRRIGLKVRAYNMAGYGNYSDPLYFGQLGRPEKLNVINIDVDRKFAELEWQKPTEMESGNVDEYVIEYRVKDEGEWTTGGADIDVKHLKGKQNNLVTIKDDVYEFRVRAKNVVWLSEPSTSVFVLKPLSPRNFTLVKMDANSGIVKFKWNEPEKNTEGILTNITLYNIEYRKKGTEYFWKSSPVPVTKNTGTIFNLNLDRFEYEFRIVAQNMAGSSKPTETIYVAKPGPPKEFKIKEMINVYHKSGSAILEWEPPHDVQSNILEYTIQYKTINDEEWRNGVTVDGVQLTATQPALDLMSHVYVFRVVATNMAGAGTPSEQDSVERPSTPQEMVIADLQYENKTALLKWEAIKKKENKEITYIVEYKPKNESWKNCKKRPTKENFVGIKDLDFDKNVYEYRVIAKNIAGESNYSNVVSFEKPSAPSSLHLEAMDMDVGTAELTIQTPEDDTILKYEIECFNENYISEKMYVEKLSTLEDSGRLLLNVSGLNTGSQSYTFQVKAFNRAGYSEPSSTVVVAKPGPPVNVRVTDVYSPGSPDESATIQWEPPPEDGAAPVLGYSVSYDYGEDTWDRTETTDLLNTVLKIIPEKKLGFKVRARNMAGFGNFSDPIYFDGGKKEENVTIMTE